MGGQLYGDWDRLGMTFHRMSVGGLTEELKKEYDRKGKETLKILLQHIKDQDLNWEALAQSTQDRKGHDIAYLKTAQLFSAFRYELRETFMGFDVWIGVDPTPYREENSSGKTLVDILAWNEFGGGNTPSRPLLKPTYEEVSKTFTRDILDVVKKFFGK